MNLGVVCDITNKKPECVIVHNHKTGDIGYSTYNNKLSNVVSTILNNNLYSQQILENTIHYGACNKTNPYYMSVLNDYLPFPYRILWIKKITGDINDVLEQAYQLLETEESSNEEIDQEK